MSAWATTSSTAATSNHQFTKPVSQPQQQQLQEQQQQQQHTWLRSENLVAIRIDPDVAVDRGGRHPTSTNAPDIEANDNHNKSNKNCTITANSTSSRFPSDNDTARAGGDDATFTVWAMREDLFHQWNATCTRTSKVNGSAVMTTSPPTLATSDAVPLIVEDATGMRPYSASLAFVYFCHAFLWDTVLAQAESIVELGAGLALCSLYLARQYQNQHDQKQGEPQQHAQPQLESLESRPTVPFLLATDGEPAALALASYNARQLRLLPPQPTVLDSAAGAAHAVLKPSPPTSAQAAAPAAWLHFGSLTWSQEAAFNLMEQLGDSNSNDRSTAASPKRTFQFVIGTDLFYYRTDVEALMATINVLLVPITEQCPGMVFLPALIRHAQIPHKLLLGAKQHNMMVWKLSRWHRLLPAVALQEIVAWYHLDFLVLTRKRQKQGWVNTTSASMTVDQDDDDGELNHLPPVWQQALRQAGIQSYDPDREEEAEDDDEEGEVS